MSNEPYMKYFYRKIMEKPPWETFRACYLWHLKEMVDYYFSWGKHGFLSECLKEFEIEERARKIALMSWKLRDIRLVIDSVAVDSTINQVRIKKTEGREDFVRWVEEKEHLEVAEN